MAGWCLVYSQAQAGLGKVLPDKLSPAGQCHYSHPPGLSALSCRENVETVLQEEGVLHRHCRALHGDTAHQQGEGSHHLRRPPFVNVASQPFLLPQTSTGGKSRREVWLVLKTRSFMCEQLKSSCTESLLYNMIFFAMSIFFTIFGYFCQIFFTALYLLCALLLDLMYYTVSIQWNNQKRKETGKKAGNEDLRKSSRWWPVPQTCN